MTERIALITGGSSGIGAACVRRLAADGCQVALTYRSQEDVALALAEEVGGKAFALDLADPASVPALVQQVEAEMGRVNVLVHNAGLIRDAIVPFLTEESWDAVFEVNLRGVFRLTKALIRPMLVGRWGRVISIASISGLVGHVGQAHYSAAKAGLIAFTKTIAREAATYGVTANAIAPGFIATEMIAHVPEETLAEYLTSVPLGRVGQPEEVAELVAYLASEGAAYMTGQALRLDGGLVMA